MSFSTASRFIQFISRWDNKLFGRWKDIKGGILFKNKYAQRIAVRHPNFNHYNNVLFVAPLWKWGLAIVPLWGAIQGFPETKFIDFRQTLALTFTGFTWTYYCFLVKPTAWMLVAVNMALGMSNMYHLRRKIRYDKEQELLKQTASVELVEE